MDVVTLRILAQGSKVIETRREQLFGIVGCLFYLKRHVLGRNRRIGLSCHYLAKDESQDDDMKVEMSKSAFEYV